MDEWMNEWNEWIDRFNPNLIAPGRSCVNEWNEWIDRFDPNLITPGRSWMDEWNEWIDRFNPNLIAPGRSWMNEWNGSIEAEFARGPFRSWMKWIDWSWICPGFLPFMNEMDRSKLNSLGVPSVHEWNGSSEAELTRSGIRSVHEWNGSIEAEFARGSFPFMKEMDQSKLNLLGGSSVNEEGMDRSKPNSIGAPSVHEGTIEAAISIRVPLRNESEDRIRA
jgi:hypothetical protein